MPDPSSTAVTVPAAGSSPAPGPATASGAAPKIVLDGVSKTYRTRRRRTTFLGRLLPEPRPYEVA